LRRALLTFAVAAALLPASVASAAQRVVPASQQHAREGVSALLGVLADEYKAADPTHEALAAARVRTLAGALEDQLHEWQPASGARAQAAAVVHELAATSTRLQPWPPPLTIDGELQQIRTQLDRAGLLVAVPARPYEAIDGLLGEARSADRGGEGARARSMAAEAYALFAAGPGRRLAASDAAVGAAVQDAFWRSEGGRPGALVALARGSSAAVVGGALERAEGEVETVATVLGDRTPGRSTVVADAAVIVFREGLEAVLILAAITASFTGERRRLRRPVLLGALLGLIATALTYLAAQALLDALGDGGLRLQAITGLIAIAVLLLVTNWFFHRVYWSEWIGRFHRRRRALERIDRFDVFSGQLVAFTVLGLSSVYREGFETVLFLQNLQVSAGSTATALGIAIGLAATFAVGFVTFKLERKLPYRKMLIATGVLIGLVLAVMVGTTVHTMQGLGWVPSSSTGFHLDLWTGQWLGLYPTWEGTAAQLASLLITYGSYAVARALQRRRRRAMGTLPASA
jgi:high-affinity iron transporter